MSLQGCFSFKPQHMKSVSPNGASPSSPPTSFHEAQRPPATPENPHSTLKQILPFVPPLLRTLRYSICNASYSCHHDLMGNMLEHHCYFGKPALNTQKRGKVKSGHPPGLLCLPGARNMHFSTRDSAEPRLVFAYAALGLKSLLTAPQHTTTSTHCITSVEM